MSENNCKNLPAIVFYLLSNLLHVAVARTVTGAIPP